LVLLLLLLHHHGIPSRASHVLKVARHVDLLPFNFDGFR
jgi:hypothetical protein